MERDIKRCKLEWTTGERVCLTFLEHLKCIAVVHGIELGTRTNEVIAYGKIGVTCKAFTPYIRDPAVVNIFSYEVEIFLQELYW